MIDTTGLRRVTPSRHNPWATGVEGALNDLQQSVVRREGARLDARRAAIGGLPETFGVRLMLEARPGDGGIARYVRILCPVVTASRDRTRIKVIAPDGSEQWTDWK